MLKKLNIKIFLQELVFFVIGYLLVIWGFLKLKAMPAPLRELYFSGKINITAMPGYENQNNLLNNQSILFLTYFFIGTLVLFLVLKYLKNPKGLLNGFYYLAIFGGLGLYIPMLFKPTLELQSMAFLATIVAIILIWRFPFIILQNLALVVTVSSIALFFSKKLSNVNIISVLLIVALYDFIAVYITKHMVFMAKKASEFGIGLFLILPINIKDLFKIEKNLNLNESPKKYMILGGGDLAFPLILVAGLLNESFLKSFIVFLFALIGLLGSHLIFAINKKPIPALPAIVLASTIGYIITRF